ncbi:MAG: sorbosone dehydrogenase family protein [Trueperaceae bacterium]
MNLHRSTRPPVLALLALVALFVLAGTAWGQRLEPVASGFVRPLGIVAAGDGSGRLFVVEQRGTVVAVAPDGATARWLDLQGRTRAQGERGLLGLAFHPDFAANGRVFVHYSDRDGGTVLAELTVDPSAERVDAGTEVVLFTLDQPYGNHNGGQLAFGPDGMLYLALGDGGSGGDPLGAGQDLGTPLGALLRFDVDAGGRGTLAIPSDNPFVDVAGARPEIWAYGLRNPWRFAFDPRTGDLWIADVGQNAVEEVNVLHAGAPAGANFGWRVVEGDRCFDPPQGCDPDRFVAPVATYTHDSGWGRSITGGVVPYGDAAPSLAGRYVFGDFVSGRLFVLDPTTDGYAAAPWLAAGFPVAGFGLDEAGDAYVADYGGGVLYRLTD